MDLGRAGDANIEAAGKHTAAGKRTVDDDALVTNIRAQFDEIAATSDRFKASLAPHLPRLRELRDLYFDQPALRAQIANIDKKINMLDKLATAKLAEEKFAPDNALSKQEQAQQRAERLAAIKQELGESLRVERRGVNNQLNASKKEVTVGLKQELATWINALKNDLAASTASQSTHQSESETATEAMTELKSLKTSDDIDAFATRNGLGPRAGKANDGYKRQITAELQSRKIKGANEATYAKNESAIYSGLLAKLSDPERVFGTGIKGADQHWHTKQQASEVPVMQYAENGFVRNDSMPDPEPTGSSGSGRKQVFNAAVAATLARFGWSPGSTFGDTMHFDFIEGYTNAVPGGRSAANLKHTRFSPEGDFKPMPPTKPSGPTK